MAYLIVDELHQQVPPVYVESMDDKVQLLHTQGSIRCNNHPQKQHLRKYKMKEEDMRIHVEPNQGQDLEREFLRREREHRRRRGYSESLVSSTATSTDVNLVSNGPTPVAVNSQIPKSRRNTAAT